MESMVEIKDLSKSFHLHNIGKHIKASQNINLTVGKGEFVGIVGKSGSGKSTILKCLYRTYFPQQGTILYDSEAFGRLDLAKVTDRQMIYLRKNEIGYVSQFLNVMPRVTAKGLIEDSLLDMGYDEDYAKANTQKVLKHFQLNVELWDSYPLNFSGGEKLRLNIARAMAKKPRLLLLDEPTASLDHESKLRVREMIEELKSSGTTMIGIFHDIEFMEGLCDKTYNMQYGEFI